MTFEQDPAVRAAVEDARTFALRHVAPHAADWELQRRMPVEAIAAAAEAGLIGLMAAPGKGGRGLGLAGASAVAETLAASDMAFAFALKVHDNTTASLARVGTLEQQTRYLPDLLAGRRIGAFLLTEPEAGSDAAAIATRATRDGAGWRLDGEKAWITNGVAAGLMQVFAQTDPSQGWRGIASFLVEGDRPGIERLPAYGLLGGHAAGVCGIRLDGVRLDADALFLPPGEAFKGAMRGIAVARVGVAAMCCGMMRAALDCALEATASRRAFGARIADQQGVQWLLADVATELEAARLLAFHAAAVFDEGADATVACAHAKKFAARAACKAIGDCMQVMGARGMRLDAGHPLGRHLACARMAQWVDGATEIQNVVIARELLKARRDG